MSAITYRGVAYRFPDGPRALGGVDLEVRAGEMLLVVGASGSGKSTLLRTTNGLVPHTSGGTIEGDVVVFGRSTASHKPRELADVIGFVHQDPEAQFVVDQVEADVAFVLENLGYAPAAMRRRVEEALDATAIAHLRDRSPATLSGGERQRVAIAGAIAAAPSALVLDEPTSQLDPQGADDVLAAVARLNADLGTTVVLAEHRLERAAPLADRAAQLDAGHLVAVGAPHEVVAGYPGAPSVARLGRALGWDPVPLTVRDARARATELVGALPFTDFVDRAPPTAGETLVAAQGVHVVLGGRAVLREASVEARRGEVIALLGRNGSGKTTLLRALAGLIDADAGKIAREGTVAYVPQDPNTLLSAPTVRRELTQTLHMLGHGDTGQIDAWLERLGLWQVASRHPRSLAGGERQRVAVAAVAVGGAQVLLFDEPTRGMDASSRHALERAMADHAAGGGAVVLATHDVELAARAATRAVVLGDGDVVATGQARDVLSGSLFAPQVLRVLPPFLTVQEIEAALASRSEDGP